MSSRSAKQVSVSRREDYEDIFELQFAHPPDETAEQKAARLAVEQESHRRSRSIDEELLETKRRLERKSKAIKILLLGTSVDPGCFIYLVNVRVAHRRS